MCADACNREVSSTIGVFTSCSFPSPSPRYLTASPPPTSPSNTSKLKIHHLSARTATQATNFVLTAKGVTCPSAWFHHATVSGASLKLPFPSYDSVSLTLAARTASPSEYLSKHPRVEDLHSFLCTPSLRRVSHRRPRNLVRLAVTRQQPRRPGHHSNNNRRASPKT